jgi:hypothetical protein
MPKTKMVLFTPKFGIKMKRLNKVNKTPESVPIP